MNANRFVNFLFGGALLSLSLMVSIAAQEKDDFDYSIYDTHNRWSEGGFASKEQLAQAVLKIRAAAEQESIEPIRDLLLGGATNFVCWGSKTDSHARFSSKIDDADHAQRIWSFLLKNDLDFTRLKSLEFEHIFVNWKGASTYGGGLWFSPKVYEDKIHETESVITAIITNLDCESSALKKLGLKPSNSG